MRGSKVPAKTKAAAVGLALMTSGAEASRQTGIPARTIQDWVASPEFALLRATPREDVGDTMWVAVQEAVYALQQGVTNPKAYLRDKVAAFEALVTKRALIMGEATSRVENTLLQGRGDHEQRILGDIINAELERRADADADGSQGPDPVAQLAARQAGTT